MGYPNIARDLRDGADRTPTMWFQDTDSTAPDRQRWHLDVSVPHDVAEARLQAVLDAAAGGPPDRAKMAEVMRRHGLTPAP